MLFYTQENKIIKIHTPLGEDALLLTDLSGSEGMSMLFNYELTLISPIKEIDFKEIVGKAVTVSINLPNNKERYINGIITRFAQSEAGIDEQTGQSFANYSATLSPSLWILGKTSDCEIFQGLPVPEIVGKVLKDNGITDYRFDLKENYPAWEYCVQYNETDLNFISRLLEEEGICYYFIHEEKKHTLVFADRRDCHNKCPNQEMARYKQNTGSVLEDEVIDSLEWEQEIRPGLHVIKDYNFEMPHGNLAASAPARHDIGPGNREAYFYSSGHDTIMEGKRVAKIRMEENAAQITAIAGSSDCRAFASGYKFLLKDYFRGDMNEKEYLLVSIEHEACQSYGNNSDFYYSNTFNCIPHSIQYRPPSITIKPLMPGSQTATVTGPKGEEIHIDEHGRVKVQFHWDRYGQKDENTSCWIRVSYPSAGAGFGFQSHPRIGDEVIVDFLEGDPDRPIITGAVYNGANPGAFKLPDHKTRSVIRADSTPGGGGYNELHFENKKGSEAVYLQAEKDWNILVKSNKGQNVGGDSQLTIGGNSDTNVTKSMTKTAKDITVTAVTSITFVCAGSTIVMDENGVMIKGKEIHLNP